MKTQSQFPKAISIIFIFQFLLFGLFAYTDNDFSFIYWGVFLILPLAILFLFARLKVEITDAGIHYKFFPFVNKEIFWDEIEKIEIVKISPLGDFMGWGFRYSSKFGWSYILDTKYAIAIQKKNGKKLALSIKDKESVLAYLNSIGK